MTAFPAALPAKFERRRTTARARLLGIQSHPRLLAAISSATPVHSDTTHRARFAGSLPAPVGPTFALCKVARPR